MSSPYARPKLLLDVLLKNSITNFENAEDLFSSNFVGESYSITLPVLIRVEIISTLIHFTEAVTTIASENSFSYITFIFRCSLGLKSYVPIKNEKLSASFNFLLCLVCTYLNFLT